MRARPLRYDPDPESVEQRIAAMGAGEARRMLAAMVRHVGSDAAARVWPEGPFAPRRPTAQLALTAVDSHSVRVEAERLGALIRAVEAIAAVGGGDVAAWLAHPGLRTAVWKRWGELLTECVRVVRFDLMEGFRIVEACLGELSATVRWTGAVSDEQVGSGSPALPAPCVAKVDGLLSVLRDEVLAAAPDAWRLSRLLELTELADVLDPDAARRWEALRAVLVARGSRELIDAASALLEARPKPDRVSRELMRVLGALGEADALLGAAVRWGDRHAEVIEVAAESLVSQQRAVEARFWLSEGRRLHPAYAAWDALEQSL